MIQDLGSIRPARSMTRSTLVAAIAAVIVLAPTQQAAAQNNSGRYVVATEDGSWRAVDEGTPDSVFYPSWYVGLNFSQTEWDADDFKSKSTGAGLVVGNHFSPHMRWELRHQYQQPEQEYTGAEGEEHTLSSVALDYIVAEPDSGFSPVLRAGAAIANGDELADEQTDAVGLLGLGLQWREDRWLVRMMLEQAGEDQRWGGLTVAGYLGGGTTSVAERQEPEVLVERQPVVVDQSSSPAALDAPGIAISAPKSTGSAPAVAVVACGDVFSTRVVNGVQFANGSSAQLSAKSAQQLAQIGDSYARRNYVAVDVDILASNLELAESRAAAVVAALNADGDLDGRISSRATVGAQSLSLSMKDTRRCK